MTIQDIDEEYGDKITVSTPNGIIFAAFWTNVKLHPDIVKFEVAKDGRSVVRKEAKPEPLIGDILRSFPAVVHNRNHAVNQYLGRKINESRRRYKAIGKWKTTTILKLDKEVVRSFVDTEGNDTNKILVDEDDYGRQRIIFFLRTVESLNSSHQPATLVTPSGHAVKRTRDVELQPMRDCLTATKKQRTTKEANAEYLQSEKPAWEAAVSFTPTQTATGGKLAESQIEFLLRNIEEENLDRSRFNTVPIWNSNKRIYGNIGSQTRKLYGRYVCNKVKRISTGGYVALLEQYGVDMSPTTRAELESSRTKQKGILQDMNHAYEEYLKPWGEVRISRKRKGPEQDSPPYVICLDGTESVLTNSTANGLFPDHPSDGDDL